MIKKMKIMILNYSLKTEKFRNSFQGTVEFKKNFYGLFFFIAKAIKLQKMHRNPEYHTNPSPQR